MKPLFFLLAILVNLKLLDILSIKELMSTREIKTNSTFKIETLIVTPLHIACKENNFETVQLLVAKGANVNAKSSNGISFYIHGINKTPLHFACATNYKIAEFLIGKGADIKSETIHN